MAAYHDDNLCKFASHTSLDKVAYTAALKVTQTDGTNSTTTLQSDGKGNTALTGSSNGQQLNSITLNGVTYIQTNGTGPWTKYATNAPTTDPTTNMNLSIGTAGITFKSLGTEACGSLTCYKYQVTSAASPAATQYVWFDNSSYLMRRWQYTDPSSGTTDMTINYQAVTITQPSPVQDLPTGQ
jgi:outer membrane lipoprotein-sorting protein